MIENVSNDDLANYIAETILCLTCYPGGAKGAHRRHKRAWRALPEDVRKDISNRIKTKFDEVLSSLPKAGTVEELENL